MTDADVPAMFARIPFNDHLGIEVTEAEDGHAEAGLEMREELSSNPNSMLAHGGVTYALADTVGGAAAVSVVEQVTPTVDMRIDYLQPATSDLHAVADVVRSGGSVASVDVEVTDADGHRVATARGVYKAGGATEGSPWTTGREEYSEGDELSGERD